MSDPDQPVVVEETYDATADEVWAAITDVDRMRQWYFQIDDFKPEVGFETEFDVECEGRTFPHQWRITEVEPGRKITYDWKYGGYDGDSFVCFELVAEGERTRLTLTHTVRAAFSQDIPEFTRESCVAGWEYFLKGSLKKHLTGGR